MRRVATLNQFGHAVGDPMGTWQGAARPERNSLPGRWCTLEPLDPVRHAESLYEAHASAADERDWTYLSVGPFPGIDSYRAWLSAAAHGSDPCTMPWLTTARNRRSGRWRSCARNLRTGSSRSGG